MYIEVFIFYVSYSQNNPTLHHCFLFILTGLASNEKTAYHFYSNANEGHIPPLYLHLKT